MRPSCESLDLRLHLEAGHPRPWSAEVEEHVAACAACAARARRIGAVADALRALGRPAVPGGLADRVSFAFDPLARGLRAGQRLAGLTRLPVPEALDGWVVAATQPGSRQDRATRELEELPALRAPSILDRLVRGHAPPGSERAEDPHLAPRALDRRVARELIRLPRAEVRRAASRAARRQRSGQGGAGRLSGTGPAGAVRSSKLLAGLAATLAVLLLAWAQAPDLGRGLRASDQPLGPLAQPGRPGQDLPPLARGLADGLTGGLWSVQQARLADPERSAARVPTAPRPALDGMPERDRRAPRSAARGDAQRIPLIPANRTGASRAGSPGLGEALAGSFLEKLATSGDDLAFRGLRLVELFGPEGGQVSLAYREEVLADGAGNFAVEPLEVEHPVDGSIDTDLFLAHQKQREGFVFRHRDFRVRDQAGFLAHYAVHEVAHDVLVAGRRCVELEVTRIQAPDRSYRVLADQETGLVLAYEERRADGTLLVRVAYETFELDPDLQGLPLGGAPTIFVPIDLHDPDQHPFPLVAPVAVPPGFELDEVAVADVEGSPWVRFLYGDGLEQVFLLLSPLAPTAGSPPSGGGVIDPTAVPGSRVWHFQVGAWSVLQGEVEDRQVAALGKVHRVELELLLMSAFGKP